MANNPIKILFVCTGNTCRSVMAEYLLRAMTDAKSFQTASVGIAANSHYPIPAAVGKLLKEVGVESLDHVPTRLEPKHMQWANYVLVMEEFHQEYILKHYPQAKTQVHLLKKFALDSKNDGEIPFGVSDPIGSSDDVYRNCFNEIKEAVTALISKLKSNVQP